MIKNIKTACKLIPYCTSFKSNLAGGIIFVVIGLAIEIFSKGETPIGLVFMLMAGIFPTQMLASLSVSNMIATSDWKKKLQTDIGSQILFVISFVAWTVSCLVRYFSLNNPNCEVTEATLINTMLLCALLLIVLEVYAAMAYKIYWIAFAFFIVLYLFLYSMMSFPIAAIREEEWVSFPVAVIIGYALVVVAAFAHNLVSKALYKIPLHKQAQGMIIRKAMK